MLDERASALGGLARRIRGTGGTCAMIPEIRKALFGVSCIAQMVGAVTVTRMRSTKEEGLRERIRKAIEEGRLPGQRPAHTWGGRGSGAACAVCAESISPEQFEFELEYARAGNANGLVNLHVHVSCCSTWESERRALQRSQAESAGVLFAAAEGGNMRHDDPAIK
jgi:hypothetical protein